MPLNPVICRERKGSETTREGKISFLPGGRKSYHLKRGGLIRKKEAGLSSTRKRGKRSAYDCCENAEGERRNESFEQEGKGRCRAFSGGRKRGGSRLASHVKEKKEKKDFRTFCVITGKRRDKGRKEEGGSASAC